MIIYITGGERSGKSSFAQKLALESTGSPIYLATARILDNDFQKRVDRHKSDRDDYWTTLEVEKYLSEAAIDDQVVVIDCATLWLTNFYIDNEQDVEKSLEEAKNQIDLLNKKKGKFIFISNELGMGVHSQDSFTRKFVELQGWVNQYLAKVSEEAYLMVSGIPMQIK